MTVGDVAMKMSNEAGTSWKKARGSIEIRVLLVIWEIGVDWQLVKRQMIVPTD